MNKYFGRGRIEHRVRLTFLIAILGFATAICQPPQVMAMQSLIIESLGKACLSEATDRQATEQLSLQRAREDALAQAATHLNIAGSVVGGRAEILENLQQEWNANCCTASILVEITLPEPAAAPASNKRNVTVQSKTSPPPAVMSSSSQMLAVQVWTDRSDYRGGDKMIIKLRGNKPCYARVMYRNTVGGLIQLLPNPNRTDNFFPAGTYIIPTNEDTFELVVLPPFGSEEIIVYASTTPLGNVDAEPSGGIYVVANNLADVGRRTRNVGIRTIPANKNSKPASADSGPPTSPQVTPAVSEFCEARAGITTRP